MFLPPQRDTTSLEHVTSSVKGTYEQDDLDVPAFLRKRGEVTNFDLELRLVI